MLQPKRISGRQHIGEGGDRGPNGKEGKLSVALNVLMELSRIYPDNIKNRITSATLEWVQLSFRDRVNQSIDM